MTDSDDGWLRRWVGGRRREEALGTDPAASPAAQGDVVTRLEEALARNAQLTDINGRQAHRLRQLEALVEGSEGHEDPNQLQELTAALQTGERSLRAARAAAEQASTRALELQQRLDVVERDAAQQRTRADAVEAAHSGLQTQLGPLREQARRVRKQLQFQQEQLDQERTMRKAAEAELERTAAQAAERAKRLVAAHADLAQEKTRSRDYEAEVSALRDQGASDLAAAAAQLQQAQTLRKQALEHLFGPAATEIVDSLLRHADSRDETPG
ncbi:MAG: hypothetical protein ACRBN8_17530 [Nannocystales bacterium]